MNNFEDEQVRLCQKYQADYLALDLDSRIGVSMNLFSGELPINGLRHRPEGDTNGWRFLMTNEYEDVWYDEKLIEV